MSGESKKDVPRFKDIGTATIDKQTTKIRKYDNNFYVVEVNGSVKYKNMSLDALEKNMSDDGVKYTILDRT